MVKALVFGFWLMLSYSALLVMTAPVEYLSSPIIYVDVQQPDNTRFARNVESQYLGSGKTPAGISYVKTDFERKIRGARLHIAGGAYPVYYTPGLANGKFGAKIYTLT